MTTLAALALTLGCLAGTPALVARGQWWLGRPGVALAAWLGAMVVAVASFVVALAAWLLPVPMWQRPGCSGCGAVAAFGAGMIGLAVLVGALGLLATAAERALRNARAAAPDVLELAAAAVSTHREGRVQVWYVEHDEPVAFSTRFGGSHVVVSTALAEALSPAELCSVVAHERAHLRARHDWLLLLARVNARCFPMLRFARDFESRVHLLIELVADDRAARSCGRVATAGALDVLARLATEPSAGLRARRLRTAPARA